MSKNQNKENIKKIKEEELENKESGKDEFRSKTNDSDQKDAIDNKEVKLGKTDNVKENGNDPTSKSSSNFISSDAKSEGSNSDNKSGNAESKVEDKKVNNGALAQAFLGNPILQVTEQMLKGSIRLESELSTPTRKPFQNLETEIKQWDTSGIKDGYFKVWEGSIPSFVKLEVLKNPDHRRVNDIIDQRVGLKDNNLVKQAYDAFSSETLIVRFAQNDNLGELAPDVNDFVSGKGVIPLEYAMGARDNSLKRVDTVVSQLINLVRAYKGLNNLLLSAPNKIIFAHTDTNLTLQRIIDMKPAANDNVHAYMSAFIHDVKWFRDELINVMVDAPAVFGEIDVTSVNGIKVSADWGVTTDQFMAAIIANNTQKFMNNQMTVQDYHNLLSAMIMPEQGMLRVENPIDRMLPYIRRPSQEALNAFFLHTMISKEVKLNIINFLTDKLAGTQRLQMNTMDAIFDMKERPTDTNMISYYNAARMLFQIGDGFDINLAVVLETFSDYIDPIFADLPALDMSGSLLVIAGLLAWPIAFPRLSQKLLGDLGYRLMKSIQKFIGVGVFNEYIALNGWTKRLNGGNWEIVDTYDTKIESRNARDDYRPSIFTPVVMPPNNQRLGPNEPRTLLLNIMNSLHAFCTPILYRHHLERKEIAQMPYYSADYQAYMSWQLGDKERIMNGQRGAVSDRMSQLVTILQRLHQLHGSIQDVRSRTSGTVNWWTSFKSTIEYAADNVTPFTNYTCAKIQEWLQEQPFFVYDGARADPDTYQYPRTLGISATRRDDARPQQDTPIYISTIPWKVDQMYALAFLLGGEGDFKRFTSYSANTDPSVTGGDIKMRETLILDFESISDMWYSSLKMSETIGTVFQMSYWLGHVNAPDNPFAPQANFLGRSLILRHWTQLMSSLFKAIGAGEYESFIDYFKRYGNVETRFLQPQIVWMSKENNTTVLNVPQQIRPSMMYRNLQVMDRYAIRNLTILRDLYLSANSPFTRRSRGLIIGRVGVEYREPKINAETLYRWFGNEIDGSELQFVVAPYALGEAKAIEFPEIGRVLSPLDSRLRGILLTFDSPSQIPLTHINWLVQAIMIGHIAVRFLEKEVVYDIRDEMSRVSPSNEEMTTLQLRDLLMSDVSEAYEHTFVSNVHAMNFASNVEINTGSIQYTSMENEPYDNIAVAIVATTTVPPGNHQPIDGENWGFGTYEADDYVGTMPLSGEPKLSSGIVNLNNKVPTVLRGMYEPKPIVSFERVAITNLRA